MTKERYAEIPVDEIRPAKDPVRKTRDEEKIKELAQSISEKGVLQPIKIRPVEFDGSTSYEIVFGARRWEACRLLGFETIPAIISEMTLARAFQEGVIENIQREDMPDIELSEAFNAMTDDNGKPLSARQISFIVGKSTRRVETLKNLMGSRKTIAEAFVNEFTNANLSSHLGKNSQTGQPKEFPRDLATKAMFIDEHVKDPKLQEEIARKVIREELGQARTEQVAAAIEKAPTPKAKKKLLNWEFSTNLHNPELIQDRAEKFGAHDPLWQDEEPPPEDEWKKAPDVKNLLDSLDRSIEFFNSTIKAIRKSLKVSGKLPFEAKQFLANRLQKLSNNINQLIEDLEKGK